MNRVKVLCIGNSLVADDAFGPHIFEQLKNLQWATNLDLRMLGVGGLDLLSEFEGEDLIVVVDATKTGREPGALTVVPWQQIEKVEGAPVTSHDIGLDEVMKVGRLLHPETMPKEVFFVGVEGANFNDVGQPMTRTVQAAVPIALAAIKRLVQ